MIIMFELEAIDPTGARAGILDTGHGRIPTPVFMPVATRAVLRTLDSEDLKKIGTRMLISNAFLLHLRPGNEIIGESGGIHEFMNWSGALFTDSGGFQMIRREFLQKITDHGIVLRSPYDGKMIEVTPEDVIEWMRYQRPDVGMVLDDLPPHGADGTRNLESVERTISWAQRSLVAKEETDPGSRRINLFAILQGGTDANMRRKCIEGIATMDFPGYAIGGLSIGETRDEMMDMIHLTTSLVPCEKPVYLMGLGSPLELLDSMAAGVDIFDSVFPARHARHHTVLTSRGQYSIKSSRTARDLGPLDPDCQCETCTNYSKAYIHHLVRTREFGWMRMVTIHNLHFILRLMADAREAIMEDRFDSFRNGFATKYRQLNG